MKQTALIIFDLDGTLANSMDLILDIYNNDLAQRFGCKQVDKAKIPEYRMRQPRELFREFGITPLKFPFILFRAKRLMQARKEEIEIFSDMIPIIQQLHEKGFRLAVVTSNSTKNALTFLDKYNLTDYFEFVEGSRLMVKKDKKLRNVLKRYQLQKERLFYIGDEVRDVKACKAVGIRCGAVSWGQAHRNLLEQHQPEVIFDTASQIIEYLA